MYPATNKRSSVSSGADWKQILERPWQERACHQRVIMLLRGDLDVVVIVLERRIRNIQIEAKQVHLSHVPQFGFRTTLCALSCPARLSEPSAPHVSRCQEVRGRNWDAPWSEHVADLAVYLAEVLHKSWTHYVEGWIVHRAA